MTSLHAAFLGPPIAHRGYHDKTKGRPENSRAAISAAADAGYGIEIDLQLSSDGQAMVFHDYDLGRLTPETGAVRQRTASQLGAIPLLHADDGVPTLSEILDIVAGRAALLIELKDQDGQMGPTDGALEEATANALRGYDGPVALMSFNPHSVMTLGNLIPDVARGLTTSAYSAEDWPTLKSATRDHLRTIPDYQAADASFISHEAADLTSDHVAHVKNDLGGRVFCWTIRSSKAETEARKVADNVTFEGYTPEILT